MMFFSANIFGLYLVCLQIGIVRAVIVNEWHFNNMSSFIKYDVDFDGINTMLPDHTVETISFASTNDTLGYYNGSDIILELELFAYLTGSTNELADYTSKYGHSFYDNVSCVTQYVLQSLEPIEFNRLSKRAWVRIFALLNSWKRSASNATKAWALGILYDTVSDVGSDYIDMGVRSLCYHGSETACLSWSGIGTEIAKTAAKNALLSAQSTFGSDAMSLEGYDDMIGNNGSFASVCVSNRATNCN